MIQVEGLTKYYGPHVAIQDVSFRVEDGEIVGLLGPNGAGKTTVMRILAGFTAPTWGHAYLQDQEVLPEAWRVRRAVGYLPEHLALYPELRVTEYLRYCGQLEDLRGPRLQERLDYVLAECRLEERAGAVIQSLSRGFRQRVGLAQALLHDPPILILDEPTVGLDPLQVLEFRRLVDELSGSHTLLLSTHILSEAQQLCERVVIMNHGRVAAEGPPDRLTARVRRAETYLLRVVREGAQLSARLRELPDVLAVYDSGAGSLVVDVLLGVDRREEITAAVAQEGCGLVQFSPLELTLEEVFQALTQQGAEAS
jgi:ABC-2 type transport system ATP-binding protein